MLTQSEKFQAIDAVFPHMPTKVRAQIAARIINLDAVRAFVESYVRHNMTSYEHRVPGSHRNCMYAGIRADAMVRVYEITRQWK